MLMPPSAYEIGETMNIEYLIDGLIAIGLLVYLGYALLKPERL
jgi:K+-transporting ATPase KdpF subunit